MSPENELLRLLEEEAREQKYNRLAYTYPNEGRFARSKYPKHMELLAASGKYHELGLLGGNAVGKSLFGGYFTAVLATGRYPEWWNGYHVNRPVKWWVSGVTNDEVRASTQSYLLGDVAEKGDEYLGTGMIPREDIVHWKKSPNGNGLCDYVTVRNRSGEGGLSTIWFKSYKEGRETFQAANIDGAWNDEEPPSTIYGEIMQRFRGETENGRILTTFTPLKGMTAMIKSLLGWRDANEKEGASRYAVVVGQREVPHLDEEGITRRLAAALPHERVARESGMPHVGSGLIYPVEESSFVIPPFRIPSHFKHVFGFDGGWHNTAVCWFAYDDDTDTLYLYKDYKRGEVPIPVHAAAIKGQGVWIPGIGDVYATNQDDGKKVRDSYRDQGVRIRGADKAVDAGIGYVLTRLETGKLKVFNTCQQWLEEFRQYRREVKETPTGERSVVVKINDHLMDATRYVVMSGIPIAVAERRGSGIVYQEVSFG